ncbi:MAG: DUF4197 family protein [Chitinophagaceae bacterium]|nr:MAG: DUF4197 family protein [Chitinophagaceae bacterium]
MWVERRVQIFVDSVCEKSNIELSVTDQGAGVNYVWSGPSGFTSGGTSIALDKVDATKYYGDLVTKYNNLPTTFKKVNPDLANYVTDRATAALFDLIAKEEVNIRTNLAARSSDILKRVFGTKW